MRPYYRSRAVFQKGLSLWFFACCPNTGVSETDGYGQFRELLWRVRFLIGKLQIPEVRHRRDAQTTQKLSAGSYLSFAGIQVPDPLGREKLKTWGLPR